MIQLRAMFVVCAMLLTAAFGQPFWGEAPPPAAGASGPTVISVSYVDSSSNAPSGSVTVPSDAEYAVVFCWGYKLATNYLTAVTLGTGVGQIAFTDRHSSLDSAHNESVWSAVVTSLAGGSETLAGTRSTSMDEGGELVIVWIKGQAASAEVRDADGDSVEGSGVPSITLDSATTDLVVGLAGTSGSSPSLPTNMTWLDADHDFNGNRTRVFYGDGAVTSTTVAIGSTWSGILGITLKE